MIKRYASPVISSVWTNEFKLGLWQETELAVMQARVMLNLLDEKVFDETHRILTQLPIDISWWEARDTEIHHDLQAFIDERVRRLPPEFQVRFHEDMTSYDTEEPAFARMLAKSLEPVSAAVQALVKLLREMAIKYRYTVMMGKTHGQQAEIQSFGKRCLSWIADLSVDYGNLLAAGENLKFSKLSGAIGNYGSLTPKIEERALRLLGLTPFPGATQIMPRELYAPLAQALCQVVMTIDKIGTTIRLGARSGRPIYQEPFGKKQKGSSRMPHKKNTILTEQLEGMARMAQGYLLMIMQNIKTWEERAIEQSCVERVAWPDLFHVTMHSLKTITTVLSGLQVYPDNMMLEIIDSRGCYAAGGAKEFLRQRLAGQGIEAEDVYRMVQLAAFVAFNPTNSVANLRASPPENIPDMNMWLQYFSKESPAPVVSIKDILSRGLLEPVPELDATESQVDGWNEALEEIFTDVSCCRDWENVFSIQQRLLGEDELYKKLIE